VSRTDVAALVPEEVSGAMLNTLSAESAVMQLGTRIPLARNQTRFPVLSALPAAYFVNGDTGLKQTTEAAWSNKYMNVEEIATIVPIPEAVLDDSGFDVWNTLQPLMEGAIARLFDAAVIFGTSAPSSWPTNLVAGAVAAGNVVARGTNAQAAGGLHQDLSDLLGTLEADGYQPTAAIGNITVRGRLRGVRDTTGQTINLPDDFPTIIYPNSLAGLWPTGTNAAEVVAGDASRLIVGIRQDMTYKLLTEAVITDNAGTTIYNLAQQDMVAMRLVFRCAWALSNPINYQQGTEASRYPFAVLRSPAS
jgi:HK97 family phage major capsid protein